MAAPAFRLATPDDSARIAELRNAAAMELTRLHGRGHWSGLVTADKVAAGMVRSQVYVLRAGRSMVGTLRLHAKPRSEYDREWFTRVRRPVFLYDMAVDPPHQRQGFGRTCIAGAIATAREFPADAIRLDAYDHAAGAGGFY